MITSIADITKYTGKVAASPARAALAPRSPVVGGIWAMWNFGAADNPPSNMEPALIGTSYEWFLRPWLQHLRRESCDEVLLHLPFGALAGQNMPFHAAHLRKAEDVRQWRRFMAGFPPVLERIAQRTGRLPWVYMGCLSSHDFWTNRFAGYIFQDMLLESIENLWRGQPLCKIAIDVAGVMDEASLEWSAAMMLRRLGFEVGCEPRPMVGTPWWKYADITGFTTLELLRNTGEGGTGVGGDWAVPWTQVRGPQVVILQNETPSIEIAGHLAGGRSVTFSAWTWERGEMPREAREALELARGMVGA